jgi:succinate-semialdehyde dehydrogenase/glutarate-semialdehyde dehydrogenase
MPVAPVDSLDEAVERANGTRFGLTASGWTGSRATAQRLQRDLEAGVVTINDHAVAFGEATGCWGGTGESGIGRAHGEYGLHELVNVKYVMRDPGTDDAMPWYYPYDESMGEFLGAALPMVYGRGFAKVKTLPALAGNKRFLGRVRKGTMLANLHKML